MSHHQIIYFTLVALFIIAIFTLLIFAVKYDMKRNKKDWATLKDLKDMANNATTVEEVKAAHAELNLKGSKIHNEFIQKDLSRIDGYLRGMYKILNKEDEKN